MCFDLRWIKKGPWTPKLTKNKMTRTPEPPKRSLVILVQLPIVQAHVKDKQIGPSQSGTGGDKVLLIYTALLQHGAVYNSVQILWCQIFSVCWQTKKHLNKYQCCAIRIIIIIIQFVYSKLRFFRGVAESKWVHLGYFTKVQFWTYTYF